MKNRNTINTTTATRDARATIDALYDSLAEQVNANGVPDGETLQAFARLIASSVLKKLVQCTANTDMANKRRTIMRDRDALDRYALDASDVLALRYLATGKLSTVYDREGCYWHDESKTWRPKASTLAKYGRLDGVVISDAYDIVQEVALYAWSELTERADVLPRPFHPLTPYKVAKLDKKVRIRLDDSAKWEEVETSFVSECYRKARNYIEKQRAPRDVSLYNYSDILDGEDDAPANARTSTDTREYRRIEKYADVATATVDMYGKPTTATVGEYTAERLDDIVRSLDLTARQSEVLRLMRRGYGVKAIATYIGTSRDSAHSAVKQIRKRATANGMTPRAIEPPVIGCDPFTTADSLRGRRETRNADGDVVGVEYLNLYDGRPVQTWTTPNTITVNDYKGRGDGHKDGDVIATRSYYMGDPVPAWE